MKSIRIFTVVIFCITLIIWVVSTFFISRNEDTVAPVISAVSDSIEVSVAEGDAGLLQHVKAEDNKDGDITKDILVGKRSKFVEKGVSDVEFIVFDSSNNVGTLSLKVKYTDYRSPQFELNKPLVFEKGSPVQILDRLHLVDCIDGDISDKIKIVSSNVDSSKAGLYAMGIEASNKYGDLVSVKVPVLIVDSLSDMELSQYFVTVKKGSKDFDPMSYVKKSSGSVRVEQDVDLDSIGCYLVTLSDDTGISGMVVYVSE